MPQPTIQAARGLVDSAANDLAELRVRELKDDEEAHDDALQEQLEQEFDTAFAAALSDLTSEHGAPLRTGQDDDESVPLNGVFRFAIWHIRDNQLWLAAAHEDRECPFLLLLGCSYRQDCDDAL